MRDEASRPEGDANDVVIRNPALRVPDRTTSISTPFVANRHCDVKEILRRPHQKSVEAIEWDEALICKGSDVI